MMAMQSQSPAGKMGPEIIIPLLLVDDSSNNENLLFYMMMGQQQPTHCEPIDVPVVPVVPVEQPTETIFRTWRINEDGTKTLISESANDTP